MEEAAGLMLTHLVSCMNSMKVKEARTPGQGLGVVIGEDREVIRDPSHRV